MKLNLRQMEMLRAILDTGSASAAARMLYVTQPAVSRLLAQTEAQLGLALFERVRGRLHPTPEARALVAEIERAQAGLARVDDLARALAEHRAGVLRVTSNPSLAQAIVPAAIALFQRAHPDIPVRFRASMVQQLVQEVLNDEAEVGVTSLPAEHPNLLVTPLAQDRMVAIVPRAHALARLARIGLADLAPHPMILIGAQMPYGLMVAEAFRRHRVALNAWADVPSAYMACSMVNAGAGVAIVDPFTVQGAQWPEVAVRPLREPIELQVSVVQSRNRPLSRVAQRFVALLPAAVSRTGPVAKKR